MQGGTVNKIVVDPKTPSTLYAGMADGAVNTSANSAEKWTDASTGLSGASRQVNALAIDFAHPSTLYAGTAQGLFKTTNSGGKWTEADTGLGAANVSSLALNPADPTCLFAASGAKVYRSLNSAGSWQNFSSGLPAQGTLAVLAADPLAPARLFAGTLENGGYAILILDHSTFLPRLAR